MQLPVSDTPVYEATIYIGLCEGWLDPYTAAPSADWTPWGYEIEEAPILFVPDGTELPSRIPVDDWRDTTFEIQAIPVVPELFEDTV